MSLPASWPLASHLGPPGSALARPAAPRAAGSGTHGGWDVTVLGKDLGAGLRTGVFLRGPVWNLQVNEEPLDPLARQDRLGPKVTTQQPEELSYGSRDGETRLEGPC